MYIVWYTPANHPDIITDATLIDGDGDLLLVNPGYQYKIISVGQVEGIVPAHKHESTEMLQIEMDEYDRKERE